MINIPYSKEEIIQGLQDASLETIKWISEQDLGNFTKTVDSKWSTAQQLDHLIKSIQPIVMVLGKPRFIMRFMFGKSNRETRFYSVVVAKYEAKLAGGGVAPKQFAPKNYSEDEKRGLLDKFTSLAEKLEKRVSGLSEKELDKYVLPHPLLGKLPLREMMFFTIHHTHHHLKSLKSLYGVTT